MRKIACVVVFLFALCCLSGADLSAQSGRKPVAPANSGTSANPANQSSSDADASDSNSGVINVPVSGGETIEGDVIRVNTSLVTVPVSVMDRDGKYIPNLKRGDFHIFENGVEQKISYFGTVDQPFTVALVIDTSRSTHFKMSEMQDAAIAFVNQLKPADRVLVISFDDHINLLTPQPTNDREMLTDAIRRTKTGGSTRLYDAVEQVMTKYMKDVTGRKAVVLFTDGVDTTSRNATYEKTVSEAEESDMVFYPVSYNTYEDMARDNGGGQWPSRRGRGGIGGGWPGGGGGWPGGGRRGGWPGRGGRGGGGGSSREEYERADEYLHDLAQKSGGRFYGGDTLQDISQAFAQVADELRRQYSLGYYPKSSGQAGERRQIKVRVNQPDLVVTARDSYVYSAQKTAPAQATDPPQAKPNSPENHLDEKR